MDLSPKRSSDEAKFMERQLYRPGQTKPESNISSVSSSRSVAKSGAAIPKSAKKSTATKNSPPTGGTRVLLMILLLGFGYYLAYGTPAQRKRILTGLGVAVWLLLLGSVSYCICLPDIKSLAQEQRAIWEDQNLSREEKSEKFRDLMSSLTREQREKLFEENIKEREKKNNSRMSKFLHLSPAEQIASLKKEDEERKQRWQQRAAAGGNGGPRGQGNGGPGGAGGGGRGQGGNGGAGGGAAGGGNAAGAGAGGGRGGPGGGGGGFGGGGGPGGFGGGGRGGPGGGRDNPVAQRSRLDNSSPEARAGRSYEMGLRRAMGIGGGFGGGGPRR